MGLPSLPLELLAVILLNLDFRNLLRCRQVCLSFKCLIDKDVRVQYKIELAVAGMADGPPSTLTPAERLSILHARQDAWDRVAWTARDDVEMLQGGVWELYGNVLAQAKGKRTLHFKQIPSAIRGIKGTKWAIEDVGCKIRDFGMDPAQDLLVVIEHVWDRTELTVRIHLKSLSTGVRHPAGPQAGMVAYKPKPGGYSYAIQTSEGFLGILMSSQGEDASELLIWEWRTGTLRSTATDLGIVCILVLIVTHNQHLTGPELSSFAFLTSRYLLLAVQPALELDEEIVIQGPNTPLLAVVDLESFPSPPTPTPFSEAKHVCTFHYPTLSDTCAVIAMSVRSDPAPYWSPSPTLRVPFSVAHEDRLFVITLRIVDGNVLFPLISLVPASTLLGALATLEPSGTPRELTWAEWGPRGSQLLRAPMTHSSVWVCYVYGTTFVLSAGRVVYMLDFNQLAVRRAQSGDEDAKGIVTDPVVFQPAKVFEEEVATALPYRLRRLSPVPEGETPPEAVMVAEDALVLVSSQSHIRRYSILSF